MTLMKSIVLFFSVLSIGLVHAAGEMTGGLGNAERGASIAQPCAACHGTDGNSVIAATPHLAGQHAGYLYKQLVDFKSGSRANAVMVGMVAGLSDQDMRDLSAHFASQRPRQSSAKNMDLAVLGQRLYRAGIADKGVAACSACHTPDGAGIPPVYPRISGQDTEYTAAQLRAFRAGERKNDGNSMMRMVASRLNDEEIKALAEYLSGLR